MKIVLIVLLFSLATFTEASRLFLDSSNAFRDMLVYIDDDIQEGNGTLINNIKEHITEASKSLWTATGNMQQNKAAVKFGTVYIRTPKTWNVAAESITWQQCNKADFYVTANRDAENSDPFTKQLGNCGEPADFTRFPESFFKSKTKEHLKFSGRRMMTEFVKLRYGVFSEKPYKNILTVFDGFNFISSTCGKNINWTINQPEPMCSDKNIICNYSITPAQNYTHSIMFDTKMTMNEYFCNDHDKPHNKWAQSLQNIKCDRQSVSSVILRHSDFRENKPSPPFEDIDFKIVKGQNRKIVLVLDVSGSMTGIIANMREACLAFIKDTIEDSASVGLVTFNYGANILNNMKVMNPTNRAALIYTITFLSATGSTNIPDGLAKGIEVLGGNVANNDKVYGTIILLSDGGNNVESPYRYDYMIQKVIDKGIPVNTICYGNLADPKLNYLSMKSGGRYVFADPKQPYMDLMSKFAVKQSCDKTVHQIKMIEGSINVDVVGSVAEANLVELDKYIGHDVQITVTFVQDIRQYTIVLIKPLGTLIPHSKIVNQPTGTTLTFNIPGKPEIGMYKIQTKMKTLKKYKRQAQTFSIKFRISATPKTNARIITPTGELSSSEIDVLDDTSFIKATVDLTICSINENEIVKVNLTMVTPQNRNMKFIMTDDGIGDDSIENDKIYTKILIAKDLSELGFFNFIADVEIFDNKTNEKIQRTVELGSMRVKALSLQPIVDKVCPARITDFRVYIANSDEKLIKLEIVTTGNDGMIGKISDYEIKIRSAAEDRIRKVKIDFDPGRRVVILLDLSKDNITNPFKISIRGVDDKNNKGEWSLTKATNWDYEIITKKIAKQFKKNSKRIMVYTSFLTTFSVFLSIFNLQH